MSTPRKLIGDNRLESETIQELPLYESMHSYLLCIPDTSEYKAVRYPIHVPEPRPVPSETA